MGLRDSYVFMLWMWPMGNKWFISMLKESMQLRTSEVGPYVAESETRIKTYTK